MRNKIRAGIIGAAIVAAAVAPVTAANAASAHAARPYCSPIAPWSGYANFFWYWLDGPC